MECSGIGLKLLGFCMIVCDVFFNQKQQCHLDHLVTFWLTLEPSILEHLRLQLQVLGRTYWNESIHPWDAGSDYILYEQLHLFTMMKTRCGVKQGLWKCWSRLQNEIKTRWGDSKNEVGLKHFKTISKRGHSWWKRDHSWWKSAETCRNPKTRLKRGGGTPWIFFTAATS